ncbi:EAL domain-containing response regulator [Vibrio algarum]|uniref:EAL domain-containing response regulator n=1 Tax=Vibrio algarum TaxID=3020714 RepID=A0ABT4YX26_9VIBR|nr:EAL domain-containing response regulator [Vibrio sp. KJ40-1]MDB1126142.1 EAL domain-containing response regulator [Vibrio sp. KJ40-1]
MSKKYKDVLIVEDQLFFQDILEIALKNVVPEQTKIERASSGNRAIEIIKSNIDSIGLLLLDMKMDDGDGITVLNYLEKHSLNHIPVYIVSSLDQNFISFVMQSISDLDVRLVGFIPKDTPDSVIERISDIENDIKSYISEDIIDRRKNSDKGDRKYETKDIINKLESDLILYVQPKINIQDTAFISGYEVLSRLYDDRLGIIEPSNFFHLIDTKDKKVHFNWLVLESVFKFLSVDISVGAYRNLSVNVDPEVLETESFVEKFVTLAKTYCIDLDLITIEIIEVSQIDTTKMYCNIAQLKLLGVKFALDDFGKGYSNLDRMERIPFDEIKLDQDLISNIERNDKEKDLVVSLLRYMLGEGCNVVAEGVENQTTNDVLQSIGFPEAQGYYYSMPKPINEIDSIFMQLFTSRVSLLLGDMNAESFLEIYDFFHVTTTETIDRYLANDNMNTTRTEFVHQVKGTLKTAGLNEAVKFIDLYNETGDKVYVHRLRKYLLFFNQMLHKKVVCSMGFH